MCVDLTEKCVLGNSLILLPAECCLPVISSMLAEDAQLLEGSLTHIWTRLQREIVNGWLRWWMNEQMNFFFLVKCTSTSRVVAFGFSFSHFCKRCKRFAKRGEEGGGCGCASVFCVLVFPVKMLYGLCVLELVRLRSACVDLDAQQSKGMMSPWWVTYSTGDSSWTTLNRAEDSRFCS